MLSLSIDDYDPAGLTVIFRGTKTKTDREVPIKAEWVALVDEYLKHRPRGASYRNLFVNDYGEPIDTRDFATTLRRMKKFCDECQACRGTGYADTQGRSMLSKSGRRRREPNPTTPRCAACMGTGKVANPLGPWSLHGLRHYAATRLFD